MTCGHTQLLIFFNIVNSDIKCAYRLWRGFEPVGANLFSSSNLTPNLLYVKLLVSNPFLLLLLPIPISLLVLEYLNVCVGARRGLTLTSSTRTSSEIAIANLGLFILLNCSSSSSAFWKFGKMLGDLLELIIWPELRGWCEENSRIWLERIEEKNDWNIDWLEILPFTPKYY